MSKLIVDFPQFQSYSAALTLTRESKRVSFIMIPTQNDSVATDVLGENNDGL